MHTACRTEPSAGFWRQVSASGYGVFIFGNPFDQTALLIPPLDGAVYIVSQEDIDSGVTLEELAAWYDADPADVTDWNRNPVTGPLTAGRQLLIAGANLFYGPFQSQAPQPSEDDGSVEATPTTAN